VVRIVRNAHGVPKVIIGFAYEYTHKDRDYYIATCLSFRLWMSEPITHLDTLNYTVHKQ